MSLNLLKASLQKAPVVQKGHYFYVIHPLTDGIPAIHPDLLNEVTMELQDRIEPLKPLDKIVTMEAMGIPLATALSMKMNIPFVIIRKRQYGLPKEIRVHQATGYSESTLYINDLKKGDRVVIVDDVLSTGGTLNAILPVMQKLGVKVKGVFVAVYKGDCLEHIMEEYNVDINALTHIDIENKKVVILPYESFSLATIM